jgi:hypothetical protein
MLLAKTLREAKPDLVLRDSRSSEFLVNCRIYGRQESLRKEAAEPRENVPVGGTNAEKEKGRLKGRPGKIHHQEEPGNRRKTRLPPGEKPSLQGEPQTDKLIVNSRRFGQFDPDQTDASARKRFAELSIPSCVAHAARALLPAQTMARTVRIPSAVSASEPTR